MIECVMEVPPEFHVLDYAVSVDDIECFTCGQGHSALQKLKVAGWCMKTLTPTKMESIGNL